MAKEKYRKISFDKFVQYVEDTIEVEVLYTEQRNDRNDSELWTKYTFKKYDEGWKIIDKY